MAKEKVKSSASNNKITFSNNKKKTSIGNSKRTRKNHKDSVRQRKGHP